MYTGVFTYTQKCIVVHFKFISALNQLAKYCTVHSNVKFWADSKPPRSPLRQEMLIHALHQLMHAPSTCSQFVQEPFDPCVYFQLENGEKPFLEKGSSMKLQHLPTCKAPLVPSSALHLHLDKQVLFITTCCLYKPSSRSIDPL